MFKRGDGPPSATNSAVLVALIAALIILYVLFLPPDQRAVLLGDSSGGSTGGNTPGQTNVLFTSTVGRVVLPSQPPITHNLPTVTVRAIEQGSVLASQDRVTVSSNVFEKQPASLLFPADPTLTRNAVLSFNLESKSSGSVIIDLNGQRIFNQPMTTRGVAPISLAVGTENTLTFSASSVGFAFWKTNTYTLTNVKITADVTDLSDAMARQVFSLGENEYKAMEGAQLSFLPICRNEGHLRIFLNDLPLFDGTPDCGGINTLELAPLKLQPGENTVAFSTSDADIIVDRGSVVTSSKKEENRVFSFTVDPARAQGKQIQLRVRFADASDHRGTIRLNGNTIPLRAQDVIQLPVTSYIRQGQNTIQFEALEKDFEVVGFDVLVT